VSKFIQESDKVAEVKIETPWEARMREQNETETGEKISVEKKEKTPEEITAEKAVIEKDFRDRYAKAIDDERASVSLLESRLSETGKLSSLAGKVALQTTSYRLTSTTETRSSHPLIKALLI